jgi:hypothetical protein
LDSSVYQSWLADRGINTPGGQPQNILAAGLNPKSVGAIVARSSKFKVDSEKSQIQKLAKALVGVDAEPFSWILVDESGSLPPAVMLRSVIPSLSAVVVLDDSEWNIGDNFKTTDTKVASRPVKVFYGPSLATMNDSQTVKSSFWTAVRAWVH